MFNDIFGFETFTKIELITKGMSSDKKYYIETQDNKKSLLCIADIAKYDQKKLNLDILNWFDNMNNPIPTWYKRCAV